MKRKFGVSVLVLVSLVSMSLSSAPAHALSPDFTVAANPSSIVFVPGIVWTSTITLSPVNGFNGTVALTSTSSPAGNTCSFNPASITLGAAQTSTLSCIAASSGVYSVNVTGTSSPFSHSVGITATICECDFAITVSPTSVTVPVGTTGTSTITVLSVNGFPGTVVLASEISPQGLNCTINPSTIILGPSQTSTLSCNAPTPGVFTVTITGTIGSLVHSATVTFNVLAPLEFSVSAAPTAITSPLGTVSTSTITVAPINGFTGTIALKATTSPFGLSCSLAPTGMVLGAAQNATLSCSGVTLGTFFVNVTASSVFSSHSVVVTVTVCDCGGGFTISVSPTALSIVVGITGAATVTVSSINGITGTVVLTDTVTPQGLNCNVSPSLVVLPPSQTSTISCSATTQGVYTVTITGTMGSLSHSATLSVIVEGPELLMTASPSTLVLATGVPGDSIISVALIGGLTSSITLSSSVSPSPGLSASLNPTLIFMSGSSTLQLTGQVSGNYVVNVTAVSGSLVSFVILPVSVVQPNVPPPQFTQANWKQRLFLSKDNNQQTWNIGIKNMSGNSTIYARVVINAVDGGGLPFTVTSSIISLGPNKSMTNIQLTKSFSASDIGDTFSFEMMIEWGTSPDALVFQSTLSQNIRTSGSFTVLA